MDDQKFMKKSLNNNDFLLKKSKFFKFKIDSVRAIIEIIFLAFLYLINRGSTYYHSYSLKTDGEIFMINREN